MIKIKYFLLLFTVFIALKTTRCNQNTLTGADGSSRKQPISEELKLIRDEKLQIQQTQEQLRLRPASNSSSVISNFIGKQLRTLIGSNCLKVEKGTYPPFYECIGCVIEEAQACLDDMRLNKSGNVPNDCTIRSMNQIYDSRCCPVIGQTFQGLNLQYRGAAYPMALSCIEKVGCKNSAIYQMLYSECTAVCNYNDARTGGTICLAGFNGTLKSQSISLSLSILVLIVSLLLIIF